ncbi:TonB-dependent receptor [Carboxylicivirga mesophila]|uniref:TonB-dependent receptor n=1 Tax=Carboxylicivirga mesophila TaxID=1166478 RepID=A0ABS5KAB2_9BACT|nr:TonB-dependent receptor [Carboxylicivirga mesophila]MBS2211955.1 TonB-dependent receptor [Carboxylicivirga mesophila]
MNLNLRLVSVIVIFLMVHIMYSQERTLTGTVKDDINQPLPGVSIIIEGTTQGTISDVEGNFSLKVPEGDVNLVFSFIGFQRQVINVTGQATVTVQLLPDTEDLDEVVVVGYGTTKKKLVTGANLNVKGEELEALNTANALDAMKGITPGLNIVQNNAQPGAGTKVYIRGIGTTGNSQPLYIVDGVIQGNIDYLSTNDIESVDVLKDAASAAIYGSRGANGVILVTTKKGRKNMKATVTYDGYHGWQNIYKRPDLLTAQEYMLIKDEARVNDGLPLFDWANNIPNYDQIVSGEWKGTDWFGKAQVDNAPILNHSLNISGGSDKSVYSLGFSYFSQDGVMGKQSDSYYNRFTVRLNTEHTLFSNEQRDIVKVGQNLTYSKSKNNSIRTGNIYWNDVGNFIRMHPIMSIYDDNGDYSYASGFAPQTANPIALMDYLTKYGENDNNTMVGNAYLRIEPINNLSIQSRIGFNMWWGGGRSWTPAYNLSSNVTSSEDQVTQNMWSGYSYIWDNTATYDFTLEDHSFTMMAGNSVEYTPIAYNLSATGKETLFNKWDNAYIDNSPTIVSASGNDDYGMSIMSYFGRLSWNYNETYMFSAMLRTDGSSNFAKENRWGVFPSVSAGWVMSNASFMEGASNWLDFFKIRASWGQVGNHAISPFLYSSTMGYYDSDAEYYDASYGFGSDKGSSDGSSTRLTGSYPTRIPNEDITWETSEQLNIGFDANFLSSRMRVSFDWYDKTTKDWLVWTSVPASNGISGQMINGGDVKNTGVELSLGWNDNVGQFKYGATLSYSYNKNEVTSIANTEKIIHGQSNVMTQGSGEMYRAQEGFPIGYFWGYQTDGVIQNEAEANAYVAPAGADNAGEKYFEDQVPGDLRFVDQNGDGLINDEDKVMLGQPMPDHIVGLQLNFEYKGAFLNVTGNGAFGHQIAQSYQSGNSEWDNTTTAVFDRWYGEGTSTKMPRLTASLHERNDLYISDIFIHDADYFKISNITIGYDVKRLVPDFKVLSEAKLYFTLQNYFTFTKYDGMDPEVGYGPDGWSSGIDLGLYPASKTMMVGLNLKF